MSLLQDLDNSNVDIGTRFRSGAIFNSDRVQRDPPHPLMRGTWPVASGVGSGAALGVRLN